MMTEYDAGRHPYNSINVLLAIRWGVQAWHLDVKSTTIVKCFKKALTLPKAKTVVTSESPPELVDSIIADITQGIQYLQSAQLIHDAIDLNNFLNPVEELVTDSLEYVEERIIDQLIDAESDNEEGPILQEISKVTKAEVLATLEVIRLFEMQSGNSSDFILRLDK